MKEAIVIERADFEKVAENFLKEMVLSHRFVVEKPMTKSDAAKFLNCSIRAVDKYVAAGLIQAYRFVEDGAPRFFASEIVQALKSRKPAKSVQPE